MDIDIRDGWELGHLLYAARRDRDWSVRDAARKAGFSAQSWQNVEKGQRAVAGVPEPVVYNPSDEFVVAAATAVGMDTKKALDLAGRDRIASGEVGRARVGRAVGLEQKLATVAHQLDDTDLRALIHLAEQCAAAKRAAKTTSTRSKGAP